MSTDAWNPRQYEKFKKERSQPFVDLRALLKPAVSPQIVDLGCGTGELTQELHSHFPGAQTVGIDSSIEMLEQSSRFSTIGLSFEHGNIEEWGPTKSYDIVFSNAALQWCSGHLELFQRLKEAERGAETRRPDCDTDPDEPRLSNASVSAGHGE